MTNRGKKILVITLAALTGIGVTSYLLYKKIKKVLEYSLKVKSLKIEKLSLSELKLRIDMIFTNKANLTFVLSKQEYEIYLNGIYITTLTSNVEQVVEPKSNSVLTVNLETDPTLIFQKLAHQQKPLSLITNFKNQRLKLVTKLWVRFGLFSIPITVPYEDTIKNWTK